MAKETAAPLAAALVLVAACCQYPGAAGSAALVLAARGSAAGRIVGALLASAPLAAAFCSGGWYVPQTYDECWHATGNNGKGYGGAGYGFSGNYGYGRGCYSYHSGGYSPYVYWSTSGNPLGGMDGGRYKVCGACFAGWYCPGNNYRYICPAGQYSGGGWSWCGTCAAGSYSRAGYSSCPACPAGTYSAAGAGSCTACPAGRYSTGGQANECLKCGDDGFWDQNGGASWDPTQQGLTSEDQCKCERGLTGANCELSECGGTTAAVSLGFLLLEVQWPRHARQLSRNEAFSGISAAFRAFDANSDNHLSVDEARAGIADGGMAVPAEVAHIWSRAGGGGTRTYLGELDITISDMIQDELDRLEAQGTKDYHDHPTGGGAITAMTATYPNPLTENTGGDRSCEYQNEKPPLLEWTIDRGDKVIFRQCVFLNGEVLTGSDEGLDNDISSGGDCNGADGNVECSFEFELPGDYSVASYLHQSLWPADNTTVDVGSGPHDLGEIPTPENYELSFTIAIDPEEVLNSWKSIIHLTSKDEANGLRYPGVWFSDAGRLYAARSNQGGGETNAYGNFVYTAGKSYKIRITNIDSLLSIYVDGKLDVTAQGTSTSAPADGGVILVGTPWYTPVKATISDVIFRELEVLDISKHSYCVETKFCPEGCSWETTTVNENELECEDGTLCSVVESLEGWSCCSAQCTNQQPRKFPLHPTH